jgi:glutamyl aminopeptidase
MSLSPEQVMCRPRRCWPGQEGAGRAQTDPTGPAVTSRPGGPWTAVAMGALPLLLFLLGPARALGPGPWQEVRLPRHVLPIHYDLRLHPDLDTGSLQGRVDILLNVTSPATEVLLHAEGPPEEGVQSGITITITELVDEAGDPVPVRNAFSFPKNDYWVVQPAEPLPPGLFTLSLAFSGHLNHGLEGFYRSVYTKEDGRKVTIATTQFEPTAARSAFPCFDSPSFKTTFSTSLVRPTSGYIALSNMPVEKEVPMDDEKHTLVVFQKSVPMVTYLACFIICDFAYTEQLTARHGTRFRVYAQPSKIDQTKYALGVGANITDFFEDYFGIDFPLPKQDMIAIPDFKSGAMENWGLITYRETTLLYSPTTSSSGDKQRVATVVSHELAHQWFGNLMTLVWWDDLWLNEGFASYMEYKGVDHVHPDWKMADSQFLMLDLFPVMRIDSTITSHPIVQAVAHPDQISELFDSISYSKGASVLRMLEKVMGASAFRSGVSAFLHEFQFGSAVTVDLWRSLDAFYSDPNITVGEFMSGWTRQTGLPVLEVARAGEGRWTVRQRRFLLLGEAEPEGEETRWDVSVEWTGAGPGATGGAWLLRDQEELVIQSPSDWIKLNPGHYGFYRTNYSPADWAQLTALLLADPTVLAPQDRASLLSDAFSLADAGLTPFLTPLELSRTLVLERALVPRSVGLGALRRLHAKLRGGPGAAQLKAWVRGLVTHHYQTAHGLLEMRHQASHMDRLAGQKLHFTACWAGLTHCVDLARDQFNRWINDSTYSVPPNQRTLVYNHGLEAAAPAVWMQVWARYQAEASHTERSKLLRALARTRDLELLIRLVEEGRDEGTVRSQDYLKLLAYVARNERGNALVWRFMHKEWSWLVARFGLGSRSLGRLPKTVSAGWRTEDQLRALEAFFEARRAAGAGARSRAQALQQVRGNMAWQAAHTEALVAWLEENVEGDAAGDNEDYDDAEGDLVDEEGTDEEDLEEVEEVHSNAEGKTGPREQKTALLKGRGHIEELYDEYLEDF